MKKRFFVDMDGTLNVYNFNIPFERLYDKGYFLNRPPQQQIIDAVKMLIENGEEVFILSAVLKDSEYALFEKHAWLDKHLPVDCRHRIFTICGEDKIGYVPAFNKRTTDILIDDYGPNCRSWQEAGGIYLKVSRNATDADYESMHHEYVIHPSMPSKRILEKIESI